MKEIFSRQTELFSVVGRIAPDELKAFIDATPAPGKKEVKRADLRKVIEEYLAADLIDDMVLTDIAAHLSRGEAVKERRVAKGVEAHPSYDGKLLLLVKCYDPRVGGASQEGEDFRNLHLFDNITKGQIVGRVYPPKLGTPGRSVYGAPIPSRPGKPLAVGVDKTLMVEKRSGDEFEVIVAQEDGLLMQQDRKLGVKPELRINGDLDLRFGNVDFIGKVFVAGDVAPGLLVRGKRGVEIRGGVRESVIESSAGSVTIGGFAFGGTRGRIVAAEDVKLTHAQELTVEAVGTITIGKSVVDCQLRSHTMLIGSAASIVGGECRVVCGAEAREWGNDAGKKTIVRLCSDVETTADYQRLRGDIDSHLKVITVIEAHLGPYATQPTRIRLLQPALRARMEQLLEKRAAVKKSHDHLEQQRQKLLLSAGHSVVMRVNAHQQFCAGVVIGAGAVERTLLDNIPGPVTIQFQAEKGEFADLPLAPIECSVAAKKENPA